MNILWELFYIFARIGLFTFDGGYAMISIIEDICVARKKWISHEEMMNMTVMSSDKAQIVKLYPEGNAEARLKINGVKKNLFYCNRDGLFSVVPVKGIDDKQTSYDDAEERKALEQAAKVLFG